jgi:hypothetical protein
MAEPKDTSSFFRKVVKFVANPATDWAELEAPAEDAREGEYARGELKAMIERKRRNDFVRKREFEMLRKVRREGLSGEQLAALGASSRIDESQPRAADAARPGGVKAKIDEIEQQMVGDTYATTRRTPEFYNAPTEPVSLDAAARARQQAARTAAPAAPSASAATAPASAPAAPRGQVLDFPSPDLTLVPIPGEPGPAAVPAGAAAASAPADAGSASMAPIRLDLPGGADFGIDFAAVGGGGTEATHDPELDEAVIAFANADFDQCEQALATLTGPAGSRAQHAETWLVLFDLYRATGQQQKFETLANDYAQQFGWSAPQWFSMPKLVAEAAALEERGTPDARGDGQVGWIAPERIDADGVARLASLALQMPLPWVFDWSALRTLDAEASARLSELFRSWIPQDLDMRWLAGERLFDVLKEAAPTGSRDADPAFWQLRLDALRMANRPDQFDEAAIDYCVTYEVSPPSWEPARCAVRVGGRGDVTTQPPLSVVGDATTSFQESQIADEAGHVVQVANVDLSGQLVGDVGLTLARLDRQLGRAQIVNVSCARLIRVDFIAAGELLNWVLARRGENRAVCFQDAHRMVAMFFGAMGINEHAKVKVRTV